MKKKTQSNKHRQQTTQQLVRSHTDRHAHTNTHTHTYTHTHTTHRYHTAPTTEEKSRLQRFDHKESKFHDVHFLDGHQVCVYVCACVCMCFCHHFSHTHTYTHTHAHTHTHTAQESSHWRTR